MDKPPVALEEATPRNWWLAPLFGLAVCAGWIVADAIDVWALRHEPAVRQYTVIEAIVLHKGVCQ